MDKLAETLCISVRSIVYLTSLSTVFISLFIQVAFAQTPVEPWQGVHIADAPPVMLAIAYAESGGNQNLCDGVTGTHCGVFQLSSAIRAQAKSMGINANTEAGNISFALYLYEKDGTLPWIASYNDPTNPNSWGQWFNKDGTPKGSSAP